MVIFTHAVRHKRPREGEHKLLFIINCPPVVTTAIGDSTTNYTNFTNFLFKRKRQSRGQVHDRSF